MTPFGARVRALRKAKGITLKRMAADLEVSSAYLSALEHGKRGRPTWFMVQEITRYLDIIWDDAEDLARLAKLSHPRIVIDTAGLNPKATQLANRLSERIGDLTDEALDRLLAAVEK
jgi:transcriptional regulator with XRE-family HTH domain